MHTQKKIKVLSLFVLFISILTLACSKPDAPIAGPDDSDSNDNTNPIVAGDSLVFTPNESFFSPVGTLLAHQRDKTTGNIYNKFEYYDYIHSWKQVSDTIIFGVDIKTAGTLNIHPEMGIPNSQDGSKILIYLGEQSQEITLQSTGSNSTYKAQNAATFNNVSKGFYEVKLQLKSIKDATSTVGYLKNVILKGAAVKNSTNVMRRYRANAVHASWRTESENPVEISVHELTINSTNYSYYQPVTTPFGYTGSTWNKDTQTFGGYNFSLWSYGQNDPIPPFYEESHLIAVGPGLEFGSYGHEGTGVKPRGDHPYIDVDTNVQTIAVRKLPGEVYDTYWSYYLDPADGHWKLYGCGKKYNKTGAISYLHTGAFVEVPGAATKARSGHRTCETLYRGWQLDTTGTWRPVTTMVGTTGQNDESYRDWRVVGDQFSMQMGGWGEPGIEKKTLSISNPVPTPDYLKGAYLEELYKMPAKFSHGEPTNITSRGATLPFNVTELGSNASAELFWGSEEGLTKEGKWSNKKVIPVQQGSNNIELDGLDPQSTYYFRIKLTNDQGIIWSFNTQQITTESEPETTPIAQFNASTTEITQGFAVSFSDTSDNYPTSWSWTFEGGSPASSEAQNPSVTYNTPGTYSVTLVATNGAGSDTETKTAYIKVNEGDSTAPQAHYNFDGSVLDASAFSRDLSEVGGYTASYTTDRNNHQNKAYISPSEENKYLSSAYGGVSGSGKRTVTAWFKTTNAGSRKTIVSWGTNQEGKMFNVMIHGGRVRVEAGSSSLRGTAQNLDNDQWHHLAVTYNPADGDKLKDIKVYVDGQLDANTPDGDGNSYRSEDVTIDTDITTNTVRIGDASYSTKYYWRGALDDVRIYSEALSASEILGIKNN